LVDKETFDKKMSRVRFHQVDFISKHPQIKLHRTGPGWRDWDKEKDTISNIENIKVDEQNPDIILTYKVEGLKNSKWPTVTQYNEGFKIPKIDKFVKVNQIKMVIFHHENDMNNFEFWGEGVKRAYIHHCADPLIYKDYGLIKDIDILQYGAASENFYPFRKRMATMLIKVFGKRGYKVKILRHPGYDLPNPEGTYIGKELAKWINRAKLCVVTSSRLKYEFGKYSEVGLCKTLAVGDNPCRWIKGPGQRYEFFQESLLNIEPWMTDEEIIHIVEGVLDNPKELEKRTNLSYEMNQRESTMGKYAERFYDIVRGLVK
jgi:hypothetical protein